MKSCEELYSAIQPSIEAGEYDIAIEDLKQLLKLYPDFAQGHYDLGALWFATGEKQRAFEQYQESVRLEPQNTTFIKSLADYYYSEKNDVSEAKKLYHRVIQHHPNSVESIQILGNLAIVERDFETAKKFYNKVLDIEPWNHDAIIILEKLDQQKIMSQMDRSHDSAYERSQHFVQAGKIDDAITTLEALIKEQPDFAAAYNDLGVLFLQKGQKEDTLKFYEKAVHLDPNQLTFQKNLADFYFVELGRVEDALEIYFRVLSEDPTDIETLMAAGYICKALQRNSDAVVFFERVLDIEPWNFQASENLSQLNPMQIDSI